MPDLGNRLGLVSTRRSALAVWPDTRAGTQLTQKQDLASALVDVPAPARFSLAWLRVACAAVMILGLASLLLGLHGRPASPPAESRPSAPVS